MKKIIITKGTCGSGKSTWAKAEVQKDPENWVRFSNDDFRVALNNNVFSESNEKLIKKIRKEVIMNALKLGKNVIVDNINASKRNFDEVCTIVKSLDIDCQVIEKPFFVQLEEAIERDSKRIGYAKVGPEIIKKFWDKLGKKQFAFYKPLVETFYKGGGIEKIIQDEKLPKAIISDMDGCWVLIGNRSPYDASKCDEVDYPNWPVINSVKAMQKQGYKVIFMSGRENKDRAPTQRQIEKYIDFPYELYMRKTDDPRKDYVVKRELFEQNVKDRFNIEMVLDDRASVVSECWRAMGLTCFQVAEGNF